MKRTLLYVDDEPANLLVFRMAFEDDFNVLEASSAAEALELFTTHEIPVVVADQRMPEMTGVELLHVVQRDYPYTIRMLLTGYTDPDSMMEAINKGHVYNFITKPWERDTLFVTLVRALDAYDLTISNNALIERLGHADRCAALGHCAAGVAHEMRNQLFVLPLVELVEERYPHDDELVQLAGIARDTQERLDSLIKEVMDFVHKDHGTCEKIRISLGDVAREALSLAAMDERMPKQCLKLDVRAEPIILCHKVKIEQVVFNLLRNAADAVHSQDHREITCVVDCDGEEAVLSVRDNGPGIDPSHLERIWDPFFTTKGADGTGLGLDLCRGIIEAHAGRITCQSHLGQGATFNVRLPLTEDSEAVHV